MPGPTSDLVDLISARSTELAYDFSAPLVRFLREARTLCDGDLDKALVLMVIILRANQHRDYGKLKPEAIKAGVSGALPSLGTNVRSISDSTGIPKETVRRKVLDLVKKGWVVRKGGALHYSLGGYQGVTPAREEMIRMYAQVFKVIEALRDEAAATPPALAATPA